MGCQHEHELTCFQDDSGSTVKCSECGAVAEIQNVEIELRRTFTPELLAKIILSLEEGDQLRLFQLLQSQNIDQGDGDATDGGASGTGGV